MPMRTIPQAVAGSESRGGERNASPHVSLPRRGRKGHVSTRVGRRRHGLWRDARDGEVGVPPPQSRALSEGRCWIGEGQRHVLIDGG